MIQPRVRIISINPDLGRLAGPRGCDVYDREHAFARTAKREGFEYAVFAGLDASPDHPHFSIIPTFPDPTQLSCDPARLPEIWRGGRGFCDRALWSLHRLTSSDATNDLRHVFLMYDGHPGHIAPLIRLGLALGGASPIVLNLSHLHSMCGPDLPLEPAPQLRELLTSTRGLRDAANLHLRADSERLAEIFQRETGEALAVLPFFSILSVDAKSRRAQQAHGSPRRVVYPVPIPSGGRGFDLIVGLAERLRRDDVEIVGFQPGEDTSETCVPTAAARDGGLSLQEYRSGASYRDLLCSADIVVVPYRKWYSLSRTSRAVADAIWLGIPLVGTEGTWIGDQITQAGAGATFPDGDLDALADAVRRILDERCPGSARHTLRKAWLSRNDFAAFWRSVVSAGTERARRPDVGTALRLLQLSVILRVGLPLRSTIRMIIARLARHLANLRTGASGTLHLVYTSAPGSPRPRSAVFEWTPSVQWRTRRVKSIELRRDRPDGFVIYRGTPRGELLSPFWLGDGRRVFLQDASDGRPPRTLDWVRYCNRRVTVAAKPETVVRAQMALLPLTRALRRILGLGIGSLSVRAPAVKPSGEFVSIVSWSCDSAAHVAIHVDAPDGDLFVATMGSGVKETGQWVRNGTRFFLLDMRTRIPRFLQVMDAFVVTDRPARYPITGFGRLWRKPGQRLAGTVPDVATNARPSGSGSSAPALPLQASAAPRANHAFERLADAVGPDEWGIVPPPSTGELFLLTRYSAAILERLGGTRLVLFGRRGHLGMGRLFPGAPVTLRDRDKYAVEGLRGHSSLDRVVALGYSRYLAVGAHRDERSGFAHLLLNQIGVSLDCRAIELSVPSDVREAAAERFCELGLLEGRTVFIAPVAYSWRPNPTSSWIRIVEQLDSRGFCVAMNCGPGESAMPGTVAWYGDLAELYAGVELGGLLLSSRSGLVDMCCMAKTRLHVLYRDSLSAFPGLVIEQSLAGNGLPDSATYHVQGLDEDPVDFADRVLAHPDLF